MGNGHAPDAKYGRRSGTRSRRCSTACSPQARASAGKMSCRPAHRHGYLEECYYNFTFSPVHGEDGRIDGIFNAVVETTDRVLSERRLRTLSRMGQRANASLSVDDACKRAVAILAENAADVARARLSARRGWVAMRGAARDQAGAPAFISHDAHPPGAVAVGGSGCAAPRGDRASRTRCRATEPLLAGAGHRDRHRPDQRCGRRGSGCVPRRRGEPEAEG